MFIYLVFILAIFLFEFTDKILIKQMKSSNANKLKCKKSYNSKKKLSIIMNFALVLIFLISAFRYNIGWDYEAYYNTIKYGIETNIVSSGEYITIFLVKISQYLNLTNLYFVINSFLCVFLIGKTVRKYSNDFWTSMVFFICFPLFFLNSLSVVRIFSAIAITFYGIKYIKEGNFLKYFIIVLIASLFHKSAVISIIFYFIKNVNLSRKKIILLLIFLPSIGKLINKYIYIYMPRYAEYTNATSIQEGTKAILVFIVIEIFIVLFKERLIKRNNEINLYHNIYFMGLCIYLMFANQGTMGHRLSLYGTIYSLLLIPEIIEIFNSKKDKILIKILIYSLCILMFIYTIYVGQITYLPYKTIFSL